MRWKNLLSLKRQGDTKKRLRTRTRERLSIEAFERQIGIGRNSLSTSLRKKSVISHEVVI